MYKILLFCIKFFLKESEGGGIFLSSDSAINRNIRKKALLSEKDWNKTTVFSEISRLKKLLRTSRWSLFNEKIMSHAMHLQLSHTFSINISNTQAPEIETSGFLFMKAKMTIYSGIKYCWYHVSISLKVRKLLNLKISSIYFTFMLLLFWWLNLKVYEKTVSILWGKHKHW